MPDFHVHIRENERPLLTFMKEELSSTKVEIRWVTDQSGGLSEDKPPPWISYFAGISNFQ